MISLHVFIYSTQSVGAGIDWITYGDESEIRLLTPFIFWYIEATCVLHGGCVELCMRRWQGMCVCTCGTSV